MAGDELILVDENDAVVGHLDAERCHDGKGVLHRAFSVLVFDEQQELLLQRRAESKRLWGGYWSNSVCSHPRRGEAIEDAAVRRVAEEVGVTVSVEWVYRFEYRATFRDLGSEHELCSVFVAQIDADTRASIEPNPEEVADLEWVTATDLDRRLVSAPDEFTPWFQLEWSELRGTRSEELGSVLGRPLPAPGA